MTGRLLADHTIVIEGDRIVSVVSGDPPNADRVVDVRGKFVIPGLWDMHVHLNDPTTPKLFVANGVTASQILDGPRPVWPGSIGLSMRTRRSARLHGSTARTDPTMRRDGGYWALSFCRRSAGDRITVDDRDARA